MQILAPLQKNIAVKRLIAFWALAECGLGGFLHLFKIPFTGLLVGGLACICIALIYLLSQSKAQVLQSLLIVVCVKLSVSPYTPPTAYISVCFQAVLGLGVYALFRVNVISFSVAVMLCMLQSALQKLMVLTLFFGKELWQAVDGLFLFVAEQLRFIDISGTKILIATYLGIYVLGGMFVAVVFKKVLQQFNDIQQQDFFIKVTDIDLAKVRKKENKRFAKLFAILLLVLLALFIFRHGETNISKAIYLIVRTTLIIFIWFYLLTPLIGLLLKKGTAKFSTVYKSQINQSLQLFPELKQLIKQVWDNTAGTKSAKRIYLFLIHFFIALIIYQIQPET